jgi:hypothetical protein
VDTDVAAVAVAEAVAEAVIPAAMHLAMSIPAACLLWVGGRLYPQIRRQD